MARFKYELVIHAAAYWSMLLRLAGWTKWEIRDNSVVREKLMNRAAELSRSL